MMQVNKKTLVRSLDSENFAIQHELQLKKQIPEYHVVKLATTGRVTARLTSLNSLDNTSL